jgi:hypothetical protein
MNALDGIEFNLMQLSTSKPSSTAPIVGNAAPTVATALRLANGTDVVSRSAVFNVLGADDKPERNLQYQWQVIEQPTDNSVTFAANNSNAAKRNTLTFARAGEYLVRVKIQDQQGLSVSSELRFEVKQSLTSVSFKNNDGLVINPRNVINLTGANQSLSLQGFDQFGSVMTSAPSITATVNSVPTGGSATLSTESNTSNDSVRFTATFDRVGRYSFNVSSGRVSQRLQFNVVPTLTQIEVTGETSTLAPGSTRTYKVNGLDQFNQPMKSKLSVAWSATGGTITANGVYRAGTSAGSFTVTANVGRFSSSIPVSVEAPTLSSSLKDPQLAALVQSFYGDENLDRQEMINLLRSVGTDGTVSATELADFRFLVSPTTPFKMPLHVRELARDVVNPNPANLTYRGQAAGNLAAGSSTSLLTKLVDKWFLGTDEPVLASSTLKYQYALGTLFNAAPSLTDARQGSLGDCYFIASLASIAAKNSDAIRKMFIDNGDNTFTVRFFGGALGAYNSGGLITGGFLAGSGVADYVTVNRNLPVYSNGTLAYSGHGLNASSTSTSLWIALAEKAYAQWNETQNAGRDGTNHYAAIEGGWMTNVNAQVLGYNSTNHWTANSSKATLINALAANHAVTIGTNPNGTAGGLVGSHAYIVTGYNTATDKFTLHNPWGVSHPTPLTWAQLQTNTSMFVVADPSSTGAPVGWRVASASDMLVGGWTTNATQLGSTAPANDDVLIELLDDLSPDYRVTSALTRNGFDGTTSLIGTSANDLLVNQSNKIDIALHDCFWALEGEMLYLIDDAALDYLENDIC